MLICYLFLTPDCRKRRNEKKEDGREGASYFRTPEAATALRPNNDILSQFSLNNFL
jgi:hypothetical protein